MSFETVDNVNKRKAVIDKYLKNREILKKRQLDEKVNKQTFQREVATELQKPLVEQTKKVAEKAQEKTDELQDALIQQLQDNQANIIGQLGQDRNALVQAVQALPAAMPQPAALAAVSQTPKGSPAALHAAASPIVIGRVDAGVDPNVLQEQGLPLPSHFLDKTEQVTKKARIAVSQTALFKKLSVKKLRNPGEQNTFDTLQQYIKSLKAIEAGHVSGQIKQQKTGQGMAKSKSKNPYKLTADSMFGNLWIDPVKLNELRLEAYKNDKRVLSHKIDFDLLELLTKRFNTNKEYSKKSIFTFSKLIELSELPVNARSQKFKQQKGLGLKCKNQFPNQLKSNITIVLMI